MKHEFIVNGFEGGSKCPQMKRKNYAGQGKIAFSPVCAVG
jgi:hypothetical protein